METSNNFTSSNWKTLDTTAYLNSEAGSTATTTSSVASSTFNPGVQTIEGIGLRIKTRLTTGTFTVELFNGTIVTGSVTCNVTDIASTQTTDLGGWVYFQFGSPVITTAVNHSVRVKSSTAGHVTVYRDATAGNWSRFLCTAASGVAVAATDDWAVCGKITAAGSTTIVSCTFDNTSSTAFGRGEVGQDGKLILQNSASTSYRLSIATGNNLQVCHNGVIEFGTLASPVVSTSSMLLELQCASAGANNLTVRSPGSYTSAGLVRTRNSRLNADAAVSATSLTTTTSTGWLSSDVIGLGATTRSASPSTELRSLSANASGTTLTIAAIGAAKEGSAGVNCPLINVTSNMKIQGSSTTNAAFILVGDTSPTFIMDNCELQNMGSNTTNQRGINLSGTISPVITVSNNGIYNCNANFGIVTSSVITTYSITGNAIYSGIFSAAATTGTGTMQYNGNWHIGLGSLSFADDRVEWKNNLVNGATATAILQTTGTSYLAAIDNNEVSCCGTLGMNLLLVDATASNFIAWRCNTTGISITPTNSVIDGVTAFGNTSVSMSIANLSSDTEFKNLNIQSGVTATCPVGISAPASSINRGIIFSNSSIGTVTTHSTGDVSVLGAYTTNLVFRDSTLGSTNQVSTTFQGNLTGQSFVALQRSGGVAGAHRTYYKYGRVDSDSVIFDSSPLSMRMTPTSASFKLYAPLFKVNIATSGTATVSIKVRKSVVGDGSAYNGNQARVILRTNAAAGSNFDSEAVVMTSTNAANGAWETLSYTTSTATDNTTLEFWADCDGTAGWVNFDTITAS